MILCQAKIPKLPFVQQSRVSKIANSYLSKYHNIDKTGFKDQGRYDYTQWASSQTPKVVKVKEWSNADPRKKQKQDLDI